MQIATVKDFVEKFCTSPSIKYVFGINGCWSYHLDSFFIETYGHWKLIDVECDWSYVTAAPNEGMRINLIVEEEENDQMASETVAYEDALKALAEEAAEDEAALDRVKVFMDFESDFEMLESLRGSMHAAHRTRIEMLASLFDTSTADIRIDLSEFKKENAKD